MAHLKIEKLCKSYGNKKALVDFNADLSEGIYGLIGPNGAGKSTLMNILVGLLKQDSGSITFDDGAFRQSGIPICELGFLPQSPEFYKNFTAREFLQYMSELKGVPQNKTQIDILLEKGNLLEVANKQIRTFSGGMKRRLGISQAIIGNPKVLILDEPTAGLDPKERIRFRNVISSLGTESIVLLATHIVTDIAFIAKEILLMTDGKLVKLASQELLTREILGKVWEIKCGGEDVQTLMERFKVSNVLNTQSGFVLKIVSEEKPRDDATLVPANMEDVCLYYFGEV